MLPDERTATRPGRRHVGFAVLQAIAKCKQFAKINAQSVDSGKFRVIISGGRIARLSQDLRDVSRMSLRFRQFIAWPLLAIFAAISALGEGLHLLQHGHFACCSAREHRHDADHVDADHVDAKAEHPAWACRHHGQQPQNVAVAEESSDSPTVPSVSGNCHDADECLVCRFLAQGKVIERAESPPLIAACAPQFHRLTCRLSDPLGVALYSPRAPPAV